MGSFSTTSILVIFSGGVVGGGLLLLAVAIRGVPARPYGTGPGVLERLLRDLMGWRGAAAVIAGGITLMATRWVVAGVGVGLLAFGWRSLGGAAAERRAMNRLEGLAVWTESLRDTIAGAVGLEQAIPASLRVAAPAIHGPLENLVDRMSTRVPLPDALRRFADELDDPSADLIIAALIINARLRGPGLRDLLGALASSVREELDMRRKVSAERQSTRRSVQIVVVIAVGLAAGLAVFNHAYVHVYDSPLGQLVLLIVVALYAAGFFWLRKLANFETPERLFAASAGVGPTAPADMPNGAGSWQGDMTQSGMAHGGMA